MAAADDFNAGTAVLRSPDGVPAKGVPFRFGGWPAAIERSAAPLGADNRAVLAEAGLAPDEIAALEQAGILATSPRRGPAR